MYNLCFSVIFYPINTILRRGLPEHVLGKIHGCTLVIDHKSSFIQRHQITQFLDFTAFPPRHPLSLQKQPFISTHFHLSLHILFITAR